MRFGARPFRVGLEAGRDFEVRGNSFCGLYGEHIRSLALTGFCFDAPGQLAGEITFPRSPVTYTLQQRVLKRTTFIHCCP